MKSRTRHDERGEYIDMSTGGKRRLLHAISCNAKNTRIMNRVPFILQIGGFINPKLVFKPFEFIRF